MIFSMGVRHIFPQGKLLVLISHFIGLWIIYDQNQSQLKINKLSLGNESKGENHG